MRTPLFHEHEKLKARIVDFHGWDMPVWYAGIREEHLATRRHAGLFDVSHMGEIVVKGPLGAAYLDRVLTRDIPAMRQGQALYTFLLNESGGIIDDLIVSCLQENALYLLCVNSSNKDRDYAWMASRNSEGALVEDRSDAYAMLALQGPASGEILKECLGFELSRLRSFHVTVLQTPHHGELIVSRTGYTGAGGVEIFLSPEAAPALWRAFLNLGAAPCGLGARDTLRLEMGYPLHGNDINEATTPLEAGLDFAVDLGKPGFIGRDALLDQRRHGIARRLVGIEVLDRGIPREHCRCLKDGREVGTVTSGSISPVNGRGIALGYVESSIREGEELFIEVREKNLRSLVTKPPFVSGTLQA
ncbi:MAG TPA: glycine cleavage system aminomethyltransferase GcvT [Deltaproteobacteria bacterium]|nr:glycine cleavage system aminomethyltransferase GcvT [Deltaproteobacteria bacterium]HPR54601.1 glycine cleavage system aminomethyltransferase GcvT [Deltaproteobacteria bacterium]HXK48031.1 glycine cleavage system aminomethyltransferase GcvT [Deltaproteobacteria bacterium]